ncbi:hypothetical protein EC968_009411 [Mortierella alpina]|nr:hypothetical protein EC968_009411 [Mortierella alpina]
MMIKSTFTTFVFLAVLVALSSVAHAQTDNTLTVPTPTAAVTTEAATPRTIPTATITPPPRTGGNFTAIPDFGSLATLIASLATGKSANPGNAQPTGKANSAAASGMSTDSSVVLAGFGLVMLTTLVAAMGTLAL